MAVAVMNWVLEDAPDLPAHCFAVLMALASKAREDGTGAYPSQEWLSARARKSDRSVRADLATLESLGLIRRGDPGLVAHLVADERPVVWDIALERKQASGPVADDQADSGRDRKPTTARKQTSGRNATDTPQDADQQKPGRDRKQASGRKRTTGRKPASANTSQQQQQDSPPSGESPRTHTRDSGPSRQNANHDGLCDIDDIDYGFKLTDAIRRWAVRDYPTLDISWESGQFIRHHRAHGNRRASWPDAFQKWLGDSHKRQQDNLRRDAARARASPNGSKYAPGSGPVPPPRQESLSDDPEDW